MPEPKDTPMVNEQVIKGNWTELRGRVKQKWGALTDDDLALAEGNAEQLIGIVQRKTGETREKIEHDLEQMTKEAASNMDRIRHQTTTAAAAASESVRDYGDRASEAARQQYELLQQQYEQLAAGMHSKVSEAEAVVRQKPIESLLVAFGTGLLTGVVVGLALRPSRD